jgi:hypothetical protein
VLDSLLALARGKRMILVGDPMQLQPVMSEAEQQIVAATNGHNGGGGRHGRHAGRNQLVGVAQPGANNVIGKSLFAWIQERRFAPSAAVLLDQQNRMHPSIGELVSRVFYADRVRTGPAAPRRGTGLPAFPSPVTWVDTRSLRGNVESRAGGTSLFNVAEARLVTSITRNLASQAPPNLSIGVITAYAEQRDLLRRLMGPHDWPPERQLEIDTVDAFEGREKDIIVLSLVRANRRRDIGFLRLEQRLNVAISRSRRLLIIVGDTSTLRQGYFHHLVATAQQVGQIIPAPKLIGMFLSRGRRHQERDERRREGAPEEVAASVTEGHEAAATPVEGGVAPVAAMGQEDHGQGGSRRRRRRAWERRRERLRAMHEQQAAAEGETPAEAGLNGVADEAAPADGSPPPPPVADVETGPVVRPRRPRRRREPPQVVEAAPEPEPTVEAPPEPVVEPEAEKPKRTRKVAEPVAEPAIVAEAPKRRTRAKPAAVEPAVAEVEAELSAEVAEAKPVRKSRARRAEAEPAVVAEAVEVVEVKPARSRTKKVEPAQPVVADIANVVEANVVGVVEVKPARRPRAKKIDSVEPVVAESAAVAESVEVKPARRGRTKKVEPAEPAIVEIAEVVEAAKPVRRARAKTVPAPEPVSVVEVVEAKPARRTRAKQTDVAALNGTSPEPVPPPAESMTLPLPEPLPDAELATARRPRARRTSKAS